MAIEQRATGKGLYAFTPTLLAILLLVSPAGADQTSLLSGNALVETLRAGGLNIYFRHVATNWSQSDDLRQWDDWSNCDPARMRQLSDDGHADAVAIGNALRKLEIPIAQLLASPYCRTLETARLMNLGPARPSTEVMNLRAAEYFGGRDAIVASAQRLLSSEPLAGHNRVIVAHGNVAIAATTTYPAEGEALVFEPAGDGGFNLIGRIEVKHWLGLMQAGDYDE